jgi:ankyrin repeat protein
METNNFWIDKGYTKIMIECCKNNIESVKKLLNNETVLSRDPYFLSTLLHIACEENSKEMVELLFSIENCKNLVNLKDWNNDIPLHIACYNGNLEIIKILLKNGSNINIINKDGNYPLMEALENYNLEKNINMAEISNLFNHV